MQHTAKEIVAALKYLHYTGDGLNRLGGSPISDPEYDRFCKENKIPSNGGSDRESDYNHGTVRLAERIAAERTIFF